MPLLSDAALKQGLKDVSAVKYGLKDTAAGGGGISGDWIIEEYLTGGTSEIKNNTRGFEFQVSSPITVDGLRLVFDGAEVTEANLRIYRKSDEALLADKLVDLQAGNDVQVALNEPLDLAASTSYYLVASGNGNISYFTHSAVTEYEASGLFNWLASVFGGYLAFPTGTTTTSHYNYVDLAYVLT